jgi:hypothetical protein
MILRLLAAVAAAAALITFIAPVVLKLGDDYALAGVVLAGVVLMLVDLAQSLRGR